MGPFGAPHEPFFRKNAPIYGFTALSGPPRDRTFAFSLMYNNSVAPVRTCRLWYRFCTQTALHGAYFYISSQNSYYTKRCLTATCPLWYANHAVLYLQVPFMHILCIVRISMHCMYAIYTVCYASSVGIVGAPLGTFSGISSSVTCCAYSALMDCNSRIISLATVLLAFTVTVCGALP